MTSSYPPSPPLYDPTEPRPAAPDAWLAAPAHQQPQWSDPLRATAVRAELARLPGLVTWEETEVLRMLLAQAAAGEYQVIQAGDCAEDPAECTPSAVARKVGVLDALAGIMKVNTGRPVIRIGRIAGQFAKPRSSPTEQVDGVELPVFRGPLVNDPAPDAEARQARAERMLECYAAAQRATAFLRGRTGGWNPPTGAPVWTSHEALLLDYELPFLRRTPTGQTMLTSTHLPWIGERTRQPDAAHARMLAQVTNPLACKVGPSTDPDALLRLCALLDPDREPGRLTLIARMGAAGVASKLPRLVTAVREAGHPAAWLCDPMHGNTVTAPSGHKTRLVPVLIEEVVGFQAAVAGAGGVAAGLHLETTPDPVTECAWGADGVAGVAEHYTSLCDPRLNPQQAFTVAGAWGAA
ncbi:phenazine biosynthesis protein PhzC [Streptomyces lacrimifluminis]|uniref:Phospho-2-dehydro-3-deoxyheptonate aldolase n=1 Tax=Streptomyces lacrimifluminis TaxID=1500077 RepID=A0A917LDR0_9ACTN|nr:3-deoxy-7-phosphoheptulonate synthase [Streptomyces lacrimifluminis]GGJ58856.1 phospho-2-dehydro-3-deoxyheptonate aldolase [Streptomyces lacrimifluminis]